MTKKMFFDGMSDEDIFNSCKRLVRQKFRYVSREEQDDYTQIALIAYYKVREDIDENKGCAESYLKIRLIGSVLDYRRSIFGRENQKRCAVYSDELVSEISYSRPEALDNYLTLQRFLGQKDFKIISLLIQGFHYIEIAQVLGTSSSWVNLRIKAISLFCNYINNSKSSENLLFQKIMALNCSVITEKECSEINISKKLYDSVKSFIQNMHRNHPEVLNLKL